MMRGCLAQYFYSMNGRIQWYVWFAHGIQSKIPVSKPPPQQIKFVRGALDTELLHSICTVCPGQLVGGKISPELTVSICMQ